MKAKWQVGERVVDAFLGPGEARRHDLSRHTYDVLHYYTMVRFDATPPMQYNMATNPTLVEHDKLRKEATDVSELSGKTTNRHVDNKTGI